MKHKVEEKKGDGKRRTKKKGSNSSRPPPLRYSCSQRVSLSGRVSVDQSCCASFPCVPPSCSRNATKEAILADRTSAAGARKRTDGGRGCTRRPSTCHPCLSDRERAHVRGTNGTRRTKRPAINSDIKRRGACDNRPVVQIFNSNSVPRHIAGHRRTRRTWQPRRLAVHYSLPPLFRSPFLACPGSYSRITTIIAFYVARFPLSPFSATRGIVLGAQDDGVSSYVLDRNIRRSPSSPVRFFFFRPIFSILVPVLGLSSLVSSHGAV